MATGSIDTLDALPVIAATAQASLLDLGDGVALFRARSKMNTFAPEVLDLLEETIARAGKDFSALVLGNDDPRAFSAGADLAFFCAMLDGPDGPARINAYGGRGQALFVAMRQAPVPVVAAVHGFALGGGCEFQMHADATVALDTAAIGVPETAVGLLPGWGGCTRLLARALEQSSDPIAAAQQAFATVLAGRIYPSAAEAQAAGLLRATDGIEANRAALIPAAKTQALALVPGYAAPAARTLQITGAEGLAALMAAPDADHAAGRISEVDHHLAQTIASVLTGGGEGPARALPEAEIMVLEREALTMLVQRPTTRARIDHMLATGKRLPN
ncbi:enoyl-CoA hydratase/isomerase family protein [Pararhodobacter sp. CCB-MM2]|uniref:enoyl-CoA hydratase/isomerase family protein n=1 Tax=Pararhodobacter sp. CCB-MM2 TaxID=1786003 RepID=UPI000836AC0A|nr:enoyl-CoA hydratase/isomerase family protein [Pararhodobacter sp. CCB-MM2]